VLEGGNRARHGRRRSAEMPRRIGEAATLRNRDEDGPGLETVHTIIPLDETEIVDSGQLNHRST
jgi:hypothetical protein